MGGEKMSNSIYGIPRRASRILKSPKEHQLVWFLKNKITQKGEWRTKISTCPLETPWLALCLFTLRRVSLCLVTWQWSVQKHRPERGVLFIWGDSLQMRAGPATLSLLSVADGAACVCGLWLCTSPQAGTFPVSHPCPLILTSVHREVLPEDQAKSHPIWKHWFISGEKLSRRLATPVL